MLERRTMVRYCLAAALSPLSIPTLFLSANLLFSGYPRECCGHMEKLQWIATTAIPLMSYAFSFGLGLPIVLVVRWRRRETMKLYMSLGAASGAIGGYLFGATVGSDFFYGLAGALCGVVVSVAFCLIAGIGWSGRSPGTSAPTPPLSSAR